MEKRSEKTSERISKIVCSFGATSLILSGCTANITDFNAKASSLDDTQVCRNYLEDHGKLQNYKTSKRPSEQDYAKILRREINSRDLTKTGCDNVVKIADKEIGRALFLGTPAIGAVALVVHAANKGGGGSPNYSSAGTSQDTRDIGPVSVCYFCTGGPNWDWDRFNNGQFRCRDIDNGQFVTNINCSNMPQDDDRWPN